MNFLSLFSGIGGFDLGLERAGMKCVGQVEIDPFCLRVLAHYWPHVKRIEDVRDVTELEFGTVELICGGFPCQPFSCAGQRKGKEDDRYLWPEMLRVIQAYRPDWVLGENVAGIISMALDKVHSDLEGIGYTVQSFIIPACAVDAPHRRDRVWIVANRNSGSRSAEPWQQQEERAALIDPGCSRNVADPSGLRRGERNSNGGRCGERTGEEEKRAGSPDHCRWPVEPELGRVANGIPNRSHRLKALGNAVVPQVVEIIGKAIMKAETITQKKGTEL